MSYGVHRTDRAWQQTENPDDGDTNELFDAPPNEDAGLHSFVEDLLSAPEPYEPGPYTGDATDDADFWHDEPY